MKFNVIMKKEIINSDFDCWKISLEKYVPKHLISLLYNLYFIFRLRYLIIKKKTDPEDVPTQIHDFECLLCAQTQ